MKFIGSFLLTFCAFNFHIHSQVTVSGDTAYSSPWELIGQENIGIKYRGFNHKEVKRKINGTKQLKKKVIFLNFWFAACEPCLAEFNALNDLYKKYKKNKDFRFFSFTFESEEAIRVIIKKYNILFPIVTVNMKECYALNFKSGFPTNIVINKSGKVAYFFSGGVREPDKADKMFEEIIKPKVDTLLK